MPPYTLIITEKPSAAKHIAEALDTNHNPTKLSLNGVPYYTAQHNKPLIIVSALGHLYTIAPTGTNHNQYPVYTYKWTPKHEAQRKAQHTRRWIQTIATLAENADEYIDACDYDIEGSLIGYNILKHACKDKDRTAKRMKYSTLTQTELNEAYKNPQPHLNYTQIEAAQTRHEIDWLYGINLTRALTTAAKHHSGKYTTLSTGRVQTPTLKFLATREKTIQNFTPTPYYQIKAHITINNQTFQAYCEKPTIQTKQEAQTILDNCKNKKGTIENITIKQHQQPPPYPFDLGTLQAEAYRLFKYTPKQTLSTAQHLYLDALISYPRTSSQKLPPTINYKTILQNLNKNPQYAHFTKSLLTKSPLKPNQGPLQDTAHPAIYPTGNKPEKPLTTPETRILDLITRRFLATFEDPAQTQTTTITIRINQHYFHLTTQQTLKQGWQNTYKPYLTPEDIILPSIEKGQTILTRKIVLEEKQTQPPPRYNPSTILKKMEQQQIGTKATRADIIQTLHNRKYIQNEKMTMTPLGSTVLTILEQYCPTITSIKLTRKLEEKMNQIQTNTEKKETVLADAINTLKPALQRLEENEKTIGKQLTNALQQAKLQENTIGTCPVCHVGKLVIMQSRRTGKRFVACTNYVEAECKTTAPLPQKGTIKPLSRNCPRCGWPLIQTRTRYVWTFCLNPTCPRKQEGRRKLQTPNT